MEPSSAVLCNVQDLTSTGTLPVLVLFSQCLTLIDLSHLGQSDTFVTSWAGTVSPRAFLTWSWGILDMFSFECRVWTSFVNQVTSVFAMLCYVMLASIEILIQLRFVVPWILPCPFNVHISQYGIKSTECAHLIESRDELLRIRFEAQKTTEDTISQVIIIGQLHHWASSKPRIS